MSSHGLNISPDAVCGQRDSGIPSLRAGHLTSRSVASGFGLALRAAARAGYPRTGPLSWCLTAGVAGAPCAFSREMPEQRANAARAVTEITVHAPNSIQEHAT